LKLAEAARARQQRAFALAIQDKSAALVPSEAGLGVDVAKSLTRAVDGVRAHGMAVRFAAWVRAVALAPRETPVVVQVDAARLEAKLTELEQTYLSVPFAGGFHLEQGKIVPDYPRAGFRLERDKARALLRAALEVGETRVTLPAEPAPAPTDRATFDGVVSRATRWVTAEIVLGDLAAGRSLTLHADELARALRVRPGARAEPELFFDGEALLVALGDRRAAVENDAKSARFHFTPDDKIEIEPSQREMRLAAASLGKAVQSAAELPDRRAQLPLEAGKEPELTTEQAAALGVRGKVSTFTTRHPCCERRVDNIHRIADLLDGLVVKPGETLSVNAVVGPRTAKNGFVPAPTIEEGEMVETVGGGISQFATTFFNALFYGGYDIVERQPHTYWFTRYPMGHEATLSYPKPDLIFRNDTQAGMVIHTAYTKTSITISIFGDNGGRKVSAEVSARQNIVRPALEILPNPEISPDKEHVLQGGMIGWSVMVGRIIRFPDGTKKEERRKVTYKPKARRIEVHPCRVPEGEKGYTGERCPEPKDSGEASESP
jgi:vancomycin resistance protein YoaR